MKWIKFLWLWYTKPWRIENSVEPLAEVVADDVVVKCPENWFGVADVDVGAKHLRADPPIPCQDSALVCVDGAIRPCAFVADGAGSASLSHYGSYETILRLSHIVTALDDVHIQMLDGQGEESSDEECRAHALRFLMHISETIKCLAADKKQPYKEFRSTLLAVIVGVEKIFWLKVGDGHIVAEKLDGTLDIVGPLGKGEYANVTRFVEKNPSKTDFSCGTLSTAEVSGMALMTDGAAERLVSTDGKKIASRIAVFLDGVRNQSFGEKDLHSFLSDAEIFNPARGYTGDDKGMALLARKQDLS